MKMTGSEGWKENRDDGERWELQKVRKEKKKTEREAVSSNSNQSIDNFLAHEEKNLTHTLEIQKLENDPQGITVLIDTHADELKMFAPLRVRVYAAVCASMCESLFSGQQKSQITGNGKEINKNVVKLNSWVHHERL